MKFFICTYTNRVKTYCDEAFIANFVKIVGDNQAIIVDNTLDNGDYSKRLRDFTQNKIPVHRCIEPPGPVQFLRNVTKSANLCRTAFMKSGCDHMVIIESDVFPPTNVLETFKEDVAVLEYANENWGIIGGIYYPEHHDFSLNGLLEYKLPRTILSGCTMYKGELIKKTAFRLDCNITAAFPDAFMSHDSANQGYSNWNDHSIKCHHAEKGPNDRGHCDPLF